MILAAGLGTRLRPLTDTIPKPLVGVAGRPMIAYVIDLLENFGFSEVLINVHYLADQLIHFVDEENKRRKNIRLFIQDESEEILGSGGALIKAAPWLFASDLSALFLNADTLIKPNIKNFIDAHKKNTDCLCTLAVMRHAEAGIRYTGLRVNKNRINAFILPKSHSGKEELFHFPGMYILEKEALKGLVGGVSNFSIVEKLWMPLAAEGKLGAWEYKGFYQDLGTVSELREAEKKIVSGDF